MKFGLANANTGAGAHRAEEIAVLAEELGFDSLWAVDHVVMPVHYSSAYPYSRSGRMPISGDTPFADPLLWLSFAAAATSTIELATGVLVLAQRNPLVVAKQLATLDVLSRGRVKAGVGAGWLREEFDALGARFDRRGARTEEYIAVMRTVWRDDPASFAGEFVRFSDVRCFPRPTKPAGVPIIIGGDSEVAARRAGRLGDGYFPARATPDDLRRLLPVVHAAAVEAGRRPQDVEVTCGAPLDGEAITAFAEAGADRVLIVTPIGADFADVEHRLRQVAADFISTKEPMRPLAASGCIEPY